MNFLTKKEQVVFVVYQHFFNSWTVCLFFQRLLILLFIFKPCVTMSEEVLGVGSFGEALVSSSSPSLAFSANKKNEK